jgi:TolB protein
LFESNRDGNWNIYVMDASGENQTRLTTHASDDRRPSWHPGGRKILFESNRRGTSGLYWINLKNKKLDAISIQYSGEAMFAQVSPDGKQLAVALSENEEMSNIFILNKNGRIVKQITKGEFRSTFPRWNAEGTEIIYFSRKDTENQDDEIYRYNLQSVSEMRLTNCPKHNFCPSWSRDGTWIAYVTSMKETRPEIYVMKSDGSRQQRMTFNEDGDTLPNWSPFTNKLLITAYRNGNYEICEMVLGIE